MTEPALSDARRRRLVLTALLIITALLGARGIGDESSVMLSGDMARYVMNGVFVRDLIADGGVWSYQDLVHYAQHYYAKYPALSLGHHPPVPFLSLVPFLWIFGVTLLAARVAAIVWFVAAAWGLFAVASRLFTWQVAAWASAIFVTNLVVLRAGQYLLSEMPMTALVLWSVHALLVFCETRRPRQFGWFLILVVASIYAKQLAVLMFPVYALILIMSFGWRTLLTGRALIAIGIGLLMIVPMAVMTVGLSPLNYGIALTNATRLLSGERDFAIRNTVGTIISAHLSLLTMLITVASVVLLMLRRRKEVLVGLAWVVSVVVGSTVFAGAVEPARYAFGAMPAYSLLIAALANEAKSRNGKIIVVGLLSVVLWSQVWAVRDVHPSGAGGYEAAAQYVLANNREPAVLYHSHVDTGYFVFFMRKHDSTRSQIVLRTDKLLGYGILYDDARRVLRQRIQELGIRWIVAEARSRNSDGRSAVHDELLAPQFVERHRIPVVSTAAPGLDLIVYENLEAGQANLDAEIKIDLGLSQRDFAIRLRDLVGPAR